MTEKRNILIVIGMLAIISIGLIILFDLVKQKVPYDNDDVSILNGESLYAQHCQSCHSIIDDAMGPPLGGITNLLSKAQLVAFISNPDKVIQNGDLRANSLFRRYKTAMPSYAHLKEEQIDDILSYIHQQTELLSLSPFQIDENSTPAEFVSIVNPVRSSGLVIELEDYIDIPLLADQNPKKGIATIRALPSADGSLLVSDQMGIIYLASKTGVSIFLNVREKIEDFIFDPGIGTGLGSFALHPDFLSNGLFYTSHAEKYLGESAINDQFISDSVGIALQWVITEWTNKDIMSKVFDGKRREVLRLGTPTTAHGIQDIGFSPVSDKNDLDYSLLYFGVGDGGSVNLKRPALTNTLQSVLGKILRIDPLGTNSKNGAYGIPVDNPFAEDTDPLVKKEIWAYGFRNPHRFSWDTTSSTRLLATDVGEANVEEVNVIEKGKDYGWPKIEGRYGINVVADAKKAYNVNEDYLESYQLPFGQYDHRDGKAASGGFVYKGAITLLKDKYIFGDIVTGDIFYMNIDKNLSDSSVYKLDIVRNGKSVTIKELSNLNRAHLRIGYDNFRHELFIMTKNDGKIRRVSNAYFTNDKTI